MTQDTPLKHDTTPTYRVKIIIPFNTFVWHIQFLMSSHVLDTCHPAQLGENAQPC